MNALSFGVFAPNDASQVKGEWYQLSNIAANDILPLTSNIETYGLPAYDQYAQYLQQITSSDPALRTQAAAPAIAQTTAQTKQALNQVNAMPRGGEQNLLRAGIAQGGATNISNYLNQIFTQGQGAKGEFGQKSIGDYLEGIKTAGDLDQAAAAIFQNQEKLDAESAQAMEKDIAGIASQVAQAVASSGASGA